MVDPSPLLLDTQHPAHFLNPGYIIVFVFYYQTKVRKSRNPSEKKHLKQDIRSLREELRQREDKAITEILTKADVVLATNTSASVDGPLKLVKPEHFDLVVIDEAAQSLEAGCWIPLLRAPRYFCATGSPCHFIMKGLSLLNGPSGWQIVQWDSGAAIQILFHYFLMSH